MRVRNLVLAGAALALTGAALAGVGAPVRSKDVVLPNGMIAHIRYTGDVAPQLVVTPVAAVTPTIALRDPFGAGSPFVALDRMATEMDARANIMMRRAAALAAHAPAMNAAPDLVARGAMPAGSVVRYSFVSTSNGSATCSRSVQVTSAGGSAQSKVVSHQSGDCSKMGLAAPRAVSAPGAITAPHAPLPVSAPKPAATPTVPANTI